VKTTFRIVKGGVGGFLNPPGHPEHDYSVREYGGREEVGSSSLSSAITSSWISSEIKTKAKDLLAEWEAQKGEPDRNWVHQVLGYFAGCFKGTSKTPWNASDLIIDKRDPFLDQEAHAGINFIREYYPDFKATLEDFKLAKWGK
jgi:hypothetical protein